MTTSNRFKVVQEEFNNYLIFRVYDTKGYVEDDGLGVCGRDQRVIEDQCDLMNKWNDVGQETRQGFLNWQKKQVG